MSTQLNKIETPDLRRSDFGVALSEQFANIDANFQKLANIELSRGAAGKSCAYIVYNLNSIFIYPTCDAAEDIKEYNNFIQFQSNVTRVGVVDAVTKEYYEKLKAEVTHDYNIYHAHTGRSTKDYVKMCAFLLWGKYKVFSDTDYRPTDTSLTGALWKSKAEDLQKSLEVTDPAGNTHNYCSVWLRDWYMAGGVDNWASATEMDKKLALYKDHILLFDPGKITIASTPSLDVGGEYEPVGSLAYVHIDPRFRNENTGSLLKALNKDKNTNSLREDISCVLYWEPRDFHGGPGIPEWDGGFKVVNLFPQIYFDGTGFYWKINGNNTRIPVTGIEGAPGKNSQFVVVERIENIIGATPECPQGDPNNPTSGAWLPDDKAGIQSVVLNAQSGRTSYVKTMTGERAAEFQTAYSQAPGIENQKVMATDRNQMVLTRKVHGSSGWMIGGANANNNEVEHCFRILRLVGKEFFYEPINNQKPTAANVFRPLDPTFAEYNYGNPDAVQVAVREEVQQMIASLDGCPCIVMPGPAFRPDRTDSTVWFSTLKAVRISEKDTRLQLIAYCGIENQMTTNLDDHTFAGTMHELDTYSYKATGDNRNKPRGWMLPIGSPYVYSSKQDDVWASHFIHSDLGGFTSRAEATAHGETYFWGEQQALDKNNTLPTLGLPIPADGLDGKGGHYHTHQFMEVVKKRFLHIGSVNDYRTLNLVAGATKEEGHYNAAVPGRERTVGHDWQALHNRHDNVSDFYGHSGFWGEMLPLYSDKPDGPLWFAGSELHIDEPTTITRYRDLQKRKHLLNVEGDVTIGLHKHANAPLMAHRHKDGGLLIQSTLSEEVRDKVLQDKKESIFKDEFYNGLTFKFAPFLTLDRPHSSRPSFKYDEEWKEHLTRAHRETGGQNFDNRFFNSYNGYWAEPTTDAIYAKDIISDTYIQLDEIRKAHPSILAEDMVGARVLTALDGIAIYDQSEAHNAPDADRTRQGIWAKMSETEWTPTRFSVDYQGNMQTYGREVRSNHPDTLWAFHTDWRKGEWKEQVDPAVDPTGIYSGPIPSSNHLIFGTSHGYSGNTQPGIGLYNWKGINNDSLLSSKLFKGEVRDMPTGWVTDLGYIVGAKQGAPIYKTTFDFKTKKAYSVEAEKRKGGKHTHLPTIVRMWNDLLYNTGSLTVVGNSVLPVKTQVDEMKYNARFGIQSQYGMVIGGPGKAKMMIDPDGTTIQESPLQVPYTSNAECDLPSTCLDIAKHGTTGEKFIDMFEIADPTKLPKCEPGLWVKAGAVIDGTAIIQNDLKVLKGSSVRGQSRSMSFKRHINATNRHLHYPLDTDKDIIGVDKDKYIGSIMLDNGWSTARARTVDFIKQDGNPSFEPDLEKMKSAIESPIVMDLGPVYKDKRFVKFGVANLPKVDKYGNIQQPTDPEDYKVVLYGTSPVTDKFIIKNTDPRPKLWEKGEYNHFDLYAQSNGLVAIITLHIDLDWQCRGCHHINSKKLGIKGHARWSYHCGINPSWKKYPVTNNPGNRRGHANPIGLHWEYEGVRDTFDGFNWDKYLKDFPKPQFDVACNIPAISGSDVGAIAANSEQCGIRFVLTTDGKLVNDYSIGAGAMVCAHQKQKTEHWPEPYANSQGRKLIVSFTYPIAVNAPKKYYRYGWSSDVNTFPNGINLTQEEPASANKPVIWRKTYIGDLEENEVNWGPIKWEVIDVYEEAIITYYSSPRHKIVVDDMTGDEYEMPAEEGAIKIKHIADWDNINWAEYRDANGETDWDKFLDSHYGKTYNIIWQKTVTKTATNPNGEEKWLMYATRSTYSGSISNNRLNPPKILLSGIIYRVKGGSSTYNDWKTDRCYGPAANDVTVNFGLWKEQSGQMIIGFKDPRWFITSSSVQQAESGEPKLQVDTAVFGSRGRGSHWFESTVIIHTDMLNKYGIKSGITAREYHKTNGSNNSWYTENFEYITAINVTIFGYDNGAQPDYDSGNIGGGEGVGSGGDGSKDHPFVLEHKYVESPTAPGHCEKCNNPLSYQDSNGFWWVHDLSAGPKI